jgi:hypothetical protein
MQTTQQAYREAGAANNAPPKGAKALDKNAPNAGIGSAAAPPKKKGPAEQAPPIK